MTSHQEIGSVHHGITAPAESSFVRSAKEGGRRMAELAERTSSHSSIRRRRRRPRAVVRRSHVQGEEENEKAVELGFGCTERERERGREGMEPRIF